MASQVINIPRFEFIDGLRGIAAFIVVLFHLNLAIQNQTSHPFPYYLDQFFSLGYLGVQIFFVLSGFVIAYSLRTASMNLSFFTHFFIRRSLRLDPPYWATLFLILVLAGIASLTFKADAPFPFTLDQIFYNLTYLPDLVQVPFILPVAWTLCLEFQFYIIFVLLLMIIQKKQIKNHLVLWTALSLFSILQNTSLAILPLKPVTFIPHWYSFFLGCVTCWTMEGKCTKGFLGFNYLIIAMSCYWTSSPHAIVSVLTALMIYIVFLLKGLHRYLQEGLFQYMGRRSYSLYLIHWPVGMKLVEMQYKIMGGSSLLFLLLSSLFLTIFAADIFYRLIEYPSHQFSKKFRLRIPFSFFLSQSRRDTE